MTTTAQTEERSLFLEKQIDIDAPIETAFEAVLEQLSILHRAPDGSELTATLEPRPGGRWFRDLGQDDGHLWGHVQVIKRPFLLEIQGPLFMSYPALNHLQYRLEATDAGTRLTFRHRAFGQIEQEHAEGVEMGWSQQLDRIRTAAERA